MGNELSEISFKKDFVKNTNRIRREMDKGKKIRFDSLEDMDECLRKD